MEACEPLFTGVHTVVMVLSHLILMVTLLVCSGWHDDWYKRCTLSDGKWNNNNQDLICFVKIGVYMGFCVYRGTSLLWTPVILIARADPLLDSRTADPLGVRSPIDPHHQQ